METVRRKITSRDLALQELKKAGIGPDTDSGKEFLSRVAAFGIMAVQPPITEPDGDKIKKTAELI